MSMGDADDRNAVQSTETLGASRIELGGGTQTRAQVDPEVVAEYAQAMASGACFPPVVVFYDGDKYWLADGFHRLQAYLRGDRRDVPADVRQGTRRDAILFSVGANADHGLRRTNADKRRAVETLLNDEEWGAWSDREIARRTGVHNSMVSRVRGASVALRQSTRTVERDGTTYEMNTDRIGGPPRPKDDVTAEPEDGGGSIGSEVDPAVGDLTPDRELSQWFTPIWLAEVAADLALRSCPETILEPAVGNGALLHAVDPDRHLYVLGYDIDPRWVDVVRAEGWPCELFSYLDAAAPSERYDVALLNPPYEGGQDGLFVSKAMDESDVVVAVLRAVALCGKDRLAQVWGREDFGLTDLRPCSRRPSFGGGSPFSDFCVVRLERGYEGPTDVRWV